MITAIEIENFKGIGERVRIDLKPITLLYGPNSAGKSSMLHAIHYAREVLDNRNFDAGSTAAGGESIDLGGFHSLVHNHNRRKPVIIRFDLDLAGQVFPTFSYGEAGRQGKFWVHEMPGDEGTQLVVVPDEAVQDVSRDMATAWVEFSVAWSELRGSCYVANYSIGINGEFVATIRAEFGRREVEIAEMNMQHPIFEPGFAGPGEYCHSETDSRVAAWLRDAHGDDDLAAKPLPIRGLVDALPAWGRWLDFALPQAEDPSPDTKVKRADSSGAWEVRWWVGVLTQYLVGPGELLRDQLREFFYLGPLRETPARNYKPSSGLEPARWANGLAGWDTLFERDQAFAEQVSDWLSFPERLGAGYRVELRAYKELELASDLMVMLLSESPLDDVENVSQALASIPTERRLILFDEVAPEVQLQPYDVGVGISQLVPVVVLILDERVDLAAIEQPELHVHPRVQVGLGDLLLHRAKSIPSTRFFIETHSEHLIERIRRRFRETARGQAAPGNEVDSTLVAVYYVKQEQGQTVLTKIDIDSKGDFVPPWPDDFFEIDFYERLA